MASLKEFQKAEFEMNLHRRNSKVFTEAAVAKDQLLLELSNEDLLAYAQMIITSHKDSDLPYWPKTQQTPEGLANILVRQAVSRQKRRETNQKRKGY